MAKEIREVVEVLDGNGEVIENENILKLNKTYKFEGKEYDEIDLSGLENLTASDMIKAQRVLERSGTFSVIPEMTLEYACIIAANATKQPVEFFNGLSPKDAIKVKNRVTSFFYGTE